MPISETYNMDCMEYMKQFPDKHFELAIVDPPYGIGESNSCFESRGVSSEKWKRAKPKVYVKKEWDNYAPDNKYFNELKRISKNQIIWGANHFISKVPFDSSCWIVWDKDTSGDYADCELAYTSFYTAVRKIKLTWSGFRKCEQVDRIHPTQKPIALYKWLLHNYAKQGDKILDTHLGSQSSRIAAWDYGFDFYGTELDKDYFNDGNKRFEKHRSQLTLL